MPLQKINIFVRTGNYTHQMQDSLLLQVAQSTFVWNVGAQAVAQSLQVNSTLQSLDILHQDPTDMGAAEVRQLMFLLYAGAQAIDHSLRFNRTLQSMKVSH